jgi:hypothetical protein
LYFLLAGVFYSEQQEGEMGDILNRISKNYQLFTLPTFAFGAASCFDLHGSLNTFRYSSSSREADFQEMKSDWMVVGQDMKDVMNRPEYCNVKA